MSRSSCTSSRDGAGTASKRQESEAQRNDREQQEGGGTADRDEGQDAGNGTGFFFLWAGTVRACGSGLEGGRVHEGCVGHPERNPVLLCHLRGEKKPRCPDLTELFSSRGWTQRGTGSHATHVRREWNRSSPSVPCCWWSFGSPCPSPSPPTSSLPVHSTPAPVCQLPYWTMVLLKSLYCFSLLLFFLT